MNRESFDLLLNGIRNRLTRQNTVLRNCVTPENVLACGLKLLPHFIRKILVARAWIHVVAKCERYQFYREVYRIETLLHITCQIISESRHPRYCFPRFVSVWPAPEIADGIFEVCPSATKFCPSVNKPVALGFSL